MGSAFSEAVFPYDISYGSKGGPGFMTTIIETDSGHQQRIPRWELPRHKFDVSYGIKTQDQIYLIKKFYIARMGPAIGFRYRDWTDYTTGLSGIGDISPIDEYMVAIVGSDVDFQLVKRYTSGGVTRNRTITKIAGVVPAYDASRYPDANAGDSIIRVAVNGIELLSGWAVSPNSGIVTFDEAPSVLPTAGFEFHTPVAFDKSMDEALWISLDDFNKHDISPITLTEVRDVGDGSPIEFDYGGGDIYCLTEKSLTMNDKRLQIVQPVTNPGILRLPAISVVPDGYPLFAIVNIDGTNGVSVYTAEASGSPFLTLAATKGIVFGKGPNASNASQWYAFGS